MVWTLIEPGVAIVATSLATIRPLLRAMGIKGFQVTEYSTQALGISGNNGTGRGTNHSAKRSFRSANGASTDIELGNASGSGSSSGKGGVGPRAGLSRTTSDPGISPGRKSKTPSRRMASVSEGQQQHQQQSVEKKTSNNNNNNHETNASNDDEVDDNSSEKELHPGFEATDTRSPGRPLIAAPAPVFQRRRIDRQDTPVPGGLAGATWLDSSDQLDQFSSRDSSVDFPALQPEHSQTDMRMGLGTPYRR